MGAEGVGVGEAKRDRDRARERKSERQIVRTMDQTEMDADIDNRK